MLSTIGYEGSTLSDFIQTLQVAEVKTLVDIRDRAQSRRPGFSKTALEKALSEVGISYLHYRELGDPKEGRDAARSGDFAKFRQVFAGVLATDQAQAAIVRIAEATSQTSVCLLCYERDQSHCHRALVAAKIDAMTGAKTRHLGVRKFEQVRQQQGRVPDTRQSPAA